MPTPARTSLAEIVAAGRDILEAQGITGLTMQAVAARVGVRAPSLYKHVKDRDALVSLVAADALRELGASVDDAGDDIAELARGFRSFAKDSPQGYQLIFAFGPDAAATRLDPGALLAASQPVLRAAATLVGERDALEAARTITAWATGFIGMELAGAFRLGGSVDRAFDYGIAALVRGLAR